MAVPDAYRGREQTYIKHTLLTKYLDRLGHKVGSQWDSINYVDCFAGPWQSAEPDYRDTSFGIAFHVLSKCQENLSLIGKKLRLGSALLNLIRSRLRSLVHSLQASEPTRSKSSS